MSLKVQLSISKTDLLFQENTSFEVTITNLAVNPVEVFPPNNTYRMPILKVLRVDGGVEQTAQRPADMFTQEMPLRLEPKKSLSGNFSLLEFIKFERAGQYDITCIYEWDQGAGRAASEPVRVTIHEVRPRALALVSSCGGPGTAHVGAWLNVAQESQLCLSYFDLGRKPRVLLTRGLRTLPGHVLPSISVPPNGSMTNELWIAWLDGEWLQVARTAEQETAPPKMSQLMLPPTPKELVPPINWLRGPGGAEGKFFLWQGNQEGTVSRFQTVHIATDGRIEAGANAGLIGNRPVWSQAAFLADNSSRTYALTSGAGQLTLQGTTWSSANEPGKTRQLATWPGDFLAAGMLLTADNTLYGAVLLLEPGPESDRRLVLRGWRETQQGEFAATHELDLKRQPHEHVTRAIVAAGLKGEPVALIHFSGGDWVTFRESAGRLGTLPASTIGDGPVLIIFPNSTDPLIVYTDPAGKGFLFANFRGAPAQPPPSG